ncbi:hypothetical protein DCC62_22755 [candidate division KSB1 bacterium]|nr:MAG: hypothetical protein DCC62_22755 [candidate division KSB1 bacterium]
MPPFQRGSAGKSGLRLKDLQCITLVERKPDFTQSPGMDGRLVASAVFKTVASALARRRVSSILTRSRQIKTAWNFPGRFCLRSRSSIVCGVQEVPSLAR